MHTDYNQVNTFLLFTKEIDLTWSLFIMLLHSLLILRTSFFAYTVTTTSV